MKSCGLAVAALLLLCSHDMYLKLEGYFLEPNSLVSVQLFNGTFEQSDNVITRDRMSDVSVVANGVRTAIDTSQWSEVSNATVLNLKTGGTGTYLVGVSTKARSIAMEAADFNDYLAHDGVLDMIEERKRNQTTEEDAVELYSKHVKTLFQVGDERSDDYAAELGYPIEFVLLDNPYAMSVGDQVRVRLLRDGAPLPNQLVYVATNGKSHDHKHEHHDAAGAHDHEQGEGHSHDHEDAQADHTHGDAAQLRTDANGELSVELTVAGVWYLRTIHLVTSPDPAYTHESNWATLTFAVEQLANSSDHSHTHDGSTHTHAHGDDHTHSHEHAGGIPSYVFWAGSLLLIVGLFVYFNRNL